MQGSTGLTKRQPRQAPARARRARAAVAGAGRHSPAPSAPRRPSGGGGRRPRVAADAGLASANQRLTGMRPSPTRLLRPFPLHVAWLPPMDRNRREAGKNRDGSGSGQNLTHPLHTRATKASRSPRHGTTNFRRRRRRAALGGGEGERGGGRASGRRGGGLPPPQTKEARRRAPRGCAACSASPWRSLLASPWRRRLDSPRCSPSRYPCDQRG